MTNEIVKICQKHGELTKDLIHPKGKSKDGKQYYGCVLCKKEIEKKYQLNNREHIKKLRHASDQKRKLSPEFKNKKKKWMHAYQMRTRLLRGDELRRKERLWKKNWVDRNIEKVKEQQKSYKSNLRYGYVKAHLKNHYGFENPSDELIFTKATIMLLKKELLKLNLGKGKNKYVAKTKKYKRRSPDKNAERIIIEGSKEDFKKWESS